MKRSLKYRKLLALQGTLILFGDEYEEVSEIMSRMIEERKYYLVYFDMFFNEALKELDEYYNKNEKIKDKFDKKYGLKKCKKPRLFF